MLNKFNSRHKRETKSLYKTVSVQIPRPIRIPESGEITPLSSFRKAAFPPFTVVVYGLATIVATKSMQLGTVSANSAIRCCFSIATLVVITIATIVVQIFFWFSSKMAVFGVSQKCDFSVRICIFDHSGRMSHTFSRNYMQNRLSPANLSRSVFSSQNIHLKYIFSHACCCPISDPPRLARY